MNSNYRIKEIIPINYDDPNSNPKVTYRIERKFWWWWEDIFPHWPPFSSYKEAHNHYLRYVIHTTKYNHYEL